MKTTLTKVLGLSLVLGGATAAPALASETCGSRGQSLLEGRQPVEHVLPLKKKQRVGKVEFEKTVGVRLFVRPESGLTAPYLQREIDCALAQRAQAGNPGDALATPGVRASVQYAPKHLVVEVEAPSSEKGKAMFASLSGEKPAQQMAKAR